MQNNFSYKNKTGSFFFSRKNKIGHENMPYNHLHDEYEIYYLLYGERYYFIKDRTYLVQKGDLILINKHDLHKTSDTGQPNHKRILINFSESFIKTSEHTTGEMLNSLFDGRNSFIRLGLDEQKFIENLFHKMLVEIKQETSNFEICLQAFLMQLLVYINRFIESNIPKFYEHPSPIHQKVAEIVNYINTHYMEPLTLSYIADQFYISPFYLTKVFKKSTGFTFVEYLNNVRIKEAQTLLRESNRKVINVSENVGFGSISHFGRVFKSITGHSPLQYRKTNK